VDAVVVQPGWWKALRLLDDGGVVLEKPIEHGPLGVSGRDRVPHNWAPVTLKDERPCVKVPGDGTQRAQEVDAEDEVEAAQVDADARDGVGRACDGDLHATGDPGARQAVVVGHRDPELVTP
jgi:hypothetical protein